MGTASTRTIIDRVGDVSRVGLGAVVVFLGLSVVAVDGEIWKLLGIAWVAFAAMAGGAVVGARSANREHPRALVWGYGLASGAMITSAAVFLLPSAIDHDPNFGGFGLAAGILVGFGAHTVGHRFTHADVGFDHTALELSAHALAAGVTIGVVYAAMPSLGPLLGLAIVSHKGPAGYAAARRLVRDGRDPTVLLLPASGVGLTAISAGTLSVPNDPVLNAVVFGFAGGVFLHVAMDFLPKCELGGEIYEVAQVSDDAHHLLDRLRFHAVGSTFFGGVVVFLAWLVVSG